MYFWKLYKDLKLMWRYGKIAKENREILEEYGMRVDWIGRIYTVINIPVDLHKNMSSNEYMQEAWVLQQLKTYTQALLKIGLADYTYPELRKIDEPGSMAYLVIMHPELKSINLWKFILNVGLYAGLYFATLFIYNLIQKSNIDFMQIWRTISSYF